MSDLNVQADKSMSEENKTKDLTLVLPAPDGTFEAVVSLKQAQDEAKPPQLVDISTHLLDSPASMPHAQERETHIIVSTGSGHQTAAHFFQDCVNPILATLYPKTHASFTVHTTQSASTILDLTHSLFFPTADAGKPLKIILLSGDGGIVDLVNGLSTSPRSPTYTPPQLVLLPLGTANALFHSINASKHSTWGLPSLSSSTTRPLPTFTATFSPGSRLLTDELQASEPLPNNTLHGAVVVSWGMHASLVADSDTPSYRKHGLNRFKMAANDALYPPDGSPPHAYRAHISLLKNDKTWLPLSSSSHLYLVATMVSHLEAAFCISPASQPLDGKMHIVYFGPTSGDEAMRIMGLAYQAGKHVHDDKVRYEEVEGVRIEFRGQEQDARWRRVCVDGKIVSVDENGWVEVRRERGERSVLDVVVGLIN